MYPTYDAESITTRVSCSFRCIANYIYKTMARAATAKIPVKPILMDAPLLGLTWIGPVEVGYALPVPTTAGVETAVAVGYGTATPPEVATEPAEEETAGADPSEVGGDVSCGAELEGAWVSVPDWLAGAEVAPPDPPSKVTEAAQESSAV